MTTKNSALPTDVGEAKTDIVLENNDFQGPEEDTSTLKVCETETVKEVPSPGYEEYGEPPKTDAVKEDEMAEAPVNQDEIALIPDTQIGSNGAEQSGGTEGDEHASEDITDTMLAKDDDHPGKEFGETDKISETDSDTKAQESNAGENSTENLESVKPKKKRGLLKLGTAEEQVTNEKVVKRVRKKPEKPISVETETVNVNADEAETKMDEKKQSKRLSSSPTIIAIDGERTVETDEDKARSDLIDLLESLKSGKVLSGMVEGVETTENEEAPLAVIYHGAYKVIIPVFELIDLPTDYRGMKPKDVHLYLIRKRLGAEIDYVIKGVDKDSGLAIASRMDAMKSKRKLYYFGKDRDGNNLLYPGICAEARVVSVVRTGVFVEIFGAEAFISLKELSYQRVMDAKLYYQVGQRVIVKVLDIDKTDKNNVKVKASIKQAGENPYTKAIRKYTVGNCYVGMVSLVDETGVFVSLDGGIDCLCAFPKRGRPPRGARVTVRILGINYEMNRIWGAITHTALPR